MAACNGESGGTVTQIYAEKFAEEVEELSDGKMKIQVYPNGTIGGDRELLESCKDGGYSVCDPEYRTAGNFHAGPCGV